jgi:hypothetical protein
MKIRLHGTPDECATATRAITTVLPVVAVSDPYPDRGASLLVRVYLETRPPTAGPPASPAPGAGRGRRALPGGDR